MTDGLINYNVWHPVLALHLNWFLWNQTGSSMAPFDRVCSQHCFLCSINLESCADSFYGAIFWVQVKHLWGCTADSELTRRSVHSLPNSCESEASISDPTWTYGAGKYSTAESQCCFEVVPLGCTFAHLVSLNA